MKSKIKYILSIISFLSSIVIGFLALYMPPLGIIDHSVLWFTAQLLLFTASILGIDFHIDNNNLIKKN